MRTARGLGLSRCPSRLAAMQKRKWKQIRGQEKINKTQNKLLGARKTQDAHTVPFCLLLFYIFSFYCAEYVGLPPPYGRRKGVAATAHFPTRAYS